LPSFKVNVKIKSDMKGLHKLRKTLGKQKSQIAEVGHFDNKQHYIGDEISIASISLLNQVGTSKIPPRPYMQVALESPVFIKAYNKAVMNIAKNRTTIAKELPKLGRLLRDIMMGVIQSNPWAKQNSLETVNRKGFNHPLIETATMVNDIEFRLVKDVGRKRTKGFFGGA